MLKRLRKFLGHQRVVPGVGEFKETLAQMMFWASIVNFTMIAGTFYYTTLRHVLPWFDLKMFIVAVVIGGVIIYIIEFKFIVPSIWAFRGKQMDLRNEPKPKDTEEQQ